MDTNKKQSVYKIIMLVVLTAVITFLVTSIAIYNYSQNSEDGLKYLSSYEGKSAIATTLNRFRSIIDKYYLGEVNEEDLLEGAIKGYISGLKDEYTEYMTKEEMETFNEQTMGNYTGIGIYMVKDTNRNVIVVLSPIKGTPAYEAGILPGDIIYKVDDVIYTADEMNEASNKIKGAEETTVKLELIRQGETVTLEIQRKNIKINHVESEVLEGNIGYMRLSTFDEGCADEFKQEYLKLKEQKITSLILDIRNNGGGIVEEALEILELFTNKQDTLLVTVDKNNKEEITKASTDKLIDVSVVILINGNSASASEILAACMKDNNIGTLVGNKTYGKGVIQQVLTLSDGSGIKITTNEYVTPNRSKINKIGIEPDELVDLPEELQNQLDIDKKEDTQLQKAIEMLK